MTSSQPVTTPQALNFTPDNKHCYAYSGVIAVNNIETSLLDFQTNSEYIVGEIQFNTSSTGGDDYLYKVKLNETIVQEYVTIDQSDRSRPDPYITILIPPFTRVELTARNVSDSSLNDQIVAVVGKVFGMTEVGYQ